MRDDKVLILPEMREEKGKQKNLHCNQMGSNSTHFPQT
jgi:hypothetical protein